MYGRGAAKMSSAQGYVSSSRLGHSGVLVNDLSVMLEFPKYVNLEVEEGRGAANNDGRDVR